MHRVVTLLIAGLLWTSSAVAQDAATDELRRLQGVWTVTAAAQRGRPLDAIKGGILTIADRAFAPKTAAGNEFKGDLRVNSAPTPPNSISCTRTDPCGRLSIGSPRTSFG
jgi:hypothetical protein